MMAPWTRAQSPCGCEQGAAGLVVGTLGYLLFLLLRTGGWGDPGWREFWIGCGVVVVTTSLGKMIGVFLHRRAQRRVGQVAVARPGRAPVLMFGAAGGHRTRSTAGCCGRQKRA